jgi:hypothetical protein
MEMSAKEKDLGLICKKLRGLIAKWLGFLEYWNYFCTGYIVDQVYELWTGGGAWFTVNQQLKRDVGFTETGDAANTACQHLSRGPEERERDMAVSRDPSLKSRR